MTVADGLSQGFITAMCQDRRGFMWIGTLDGLNCYDGYSVRRFNYEPFSPFSLSGSTYIAKIQEDRQGLLWIGTGDCLYVFDPATERFFNINHHVSLLPGQGVVQITTDSGGTVIVHMPNRQDSIGLYRIILPDRFAEQLRQGEQPLAGVAAEHLPLPAYAEPKISLEECVGDTLILARDRRGRAFRLTKPGFQFVTFDVLQLQTPEYNILWGKGSGFFFRRKLDGRATPVQPNVFKGLIRLQDGSCVTYSGIDQYLYKYDPAVDLKNDRFNQSFLPREGFTQFLTFPYNISIIKQDRSDVIWAGTGGQGLQKVNLRNLAFRLYLSGYSVYNFHQMPDGRLWMGKIYANQLFNLHTGQMEAAPWASFFDDYKPIHNMLPDRAGNLWFVTAGTWQGKKGSIYVQEKNTRNYIQLATLPSYKESVCEQLLEDRQGNIWIAAHDGHLYRRRKGASALEHFNFSHLFREKDQHLSIYALIEDPQDGGSIWIGTSKGLIEVQDPASDQPPGFRLLRYQADNPESLSWNWVLCLYQDPATPDHLWIGTRGGGLNCFDKRTRLFKHFTVQDGLVDNVVYGIVPDDEGNLWCSTNRGLSRFNPDKETFVNYYKSDGLQENEFNTGAFLRSREGLMMFGGVNGLTVFDPREVKLSRQTPPVAITGIKVRGNPLLPAREGSPLQFAPSFEQTLTLPFSENNVTFEFAALDFANPATNRYRYRMQGIDRDWIYSGTTHFANYASLPPGDYVFKVQAATADGDWNPAGADFYLVISPPWYRNWLAYLFYLVLIAGLTWLYIRLREERLHEQHILQMKQQESERLKELDSFKNRFFANITHEFRTPLTIIMGLAERLRKGGSRETIPDNAAQIFTQGNNLLDLVNQMLELAKLESHGLVLHYVQSNISAFVRFHARSFQAPASHKNIRLLIETESPDLTMDFDPQRFRQILNNMLSNAIRHTPSGGSISLKLFRSGEETAVIEIADSGEGILPEDLPHIFNRFYRGRSPQHGDGTGGLGLELTRELVLLAGGSIQVESTPGEGSTFTIQLPVTNRAATVSTEHINSLPVPEPSDKIKTPEPPSGMPLLVVMEDNPVVADYLRSCLERYYRLLFAENGQKGIELALDHIPDIILSDVMMPLKNGLEVTDVLRNDERTSHIPIVLLTAKTHSDDRLEALRRGANAYLTKPFMEEELLLVLHNKLALQRTWHHRYAGFGRGASLHLPEQPAVALQNELIRKEDAFMKKLRSIFEAHYSEEEFYLEHLCRLVGMSSSQLHRKLAALTDQPAMHLLRSFRLNKAQELLIARPDLQVSEIADMVGFSNAAHFSRMFSKTFGKPPSEFRHSGAG